MAIDYTNINKLKNRALAASLASRGFSQAPTVNYLGVLSQALAGLTGGMAGSFEQRAQQEEKFAQEEEQKRKQSILAQTLAGISTGQIPNIQNLAQEYPELATNLAMQTRKQQQAQQEAQQQIELQRKRDEEKRAFELEKIRQQFGFKKQLVGMKPSAKVPQSEFEKYLDRERAKSLVKTEAEVAEAEKDSSVLNSQIAEIENALPQAMTGLGSSLKQKIARAEEGIRSGLGMGESKPISSALGITEEGITATATINTALGKMVATMLKPTFGGQISDGERAFLRDVLGKPTMTKTEIKEVVRISKKAQATLEEGKRGKLETVREFAGLETKKPKEGTVTTFEDLGI